eukprot:358480-Chlamydomonas_euryale.AAC.1
MAGRAGHSSGKVTSGGRVGQGGSISPGADHSCSAPDPACLLKARVALLLQPPQILPTHSLSLLQHRPTPKNSSPCTLVLPASRPFT